MGKSAANAVTDRAGGRVEDPLPRCHVPPERTGESDLYGFVGVAPEPVSPRLDPTTRPKKTDF